MNNDGDTLKEDEVNLQDLSNKRAKTNSDLIGEEVTSEDSLPAERRSSARLQQVKAQVVIIIYISANTGITTLFRKLK